MPREPGPITLPDAYRRQLWNLHSHLCPAALPHLDVAVVSEVEHALRVTLPDRLLCLAAARGADLVAWCELTKGLREEQDLPEHLVAFGEDTIDLLGYTMWIVAAADSPTDNDVFAWDYKSSGTLGYRAYRQDDDGERFDIEDGGSGFEDFVTWRWGRWQTLRGGRKPLDKTTPEIDLEASVPAEALAEFAPALVTVAPKRVAHAKFGEGTIVRDLGDKVEVDFGVHGVRRLLAAYVKRLP
jgi:hypothetical protein